MKKRLKTLVRPLFLLFVRVFGSDIMDCRTGRKLTRAILFVWRGKVYVIGAVCSDCSLKPEFLPMERLTYWKQTIGFYAQSKPDYSHEPRS